MSLFRENVKTGEEGGLRMEWEDRHCLKEEKPVNREEWREM